MAKVNSLRFSTRYQDDETELLYYGHRYYSASREQTVETALNLMNQDTSAEAIPRPPRLQYPGAMYHIMNRGDLRDDIAGRHRQARLYLPAFTGHLRR
jgi:hypothetical protein